MNTEFIRRPMLSELLEGFNLFEEELNTDQRAKDDKIQMHMESATEQPPTPRDNQQQQFRYLRANEGNKVLWRPVDPMSSHPPGYRDALQQLLQVLRSPNSPEQQQQVLQILKSNPGLMHAFIAQRQKQRQLQQQ